jgi:phosphoribosylanthranilate isomerase
MIPIIKAVAVRSSDDIAKGLAFCEYVDMLLFDTKLPHAALPGGNGKVFDWTLLKERKFPIPWFLAGGINSGNVAQAITITDAPMVDVSSSLESEPGVKDPELVEAFIRKVKCL